MWFLLCLVDICGKGIACCLIISTVDMHMRRSRSVGGEYSFTLLKVLGS